MMPTKSENASPAWQTLAESLGGSFTAHTRGLFNPELVLLDRTGDPFGRLAPRGAGGATLTAGDAEARIERTNTPGYEMTSKGVSLLTAETSGPATTPGIRTANQAYETRISLLRNRATAQTTEDRTTARISGGLSNRRYRTTFDPEDPAALPVALFLLYRLNTLRSRAYQARS